MLVIALVLAVLLAWGPPAVHSRFKTISFSSVTQCGSFNVHFSGGKLPLSLPLTLTVVPFNSTPISVVIPSFSWDSATATGAVVTFLPLPAGAEFVASLDDAYGRPTGLVSDVIAVEPSANTSCLPDPTAIPTPRYALPDIKAFSQCTPFNLSYAPGIVDVPPTVRAFVLKNNSFPVNATSVPGAGIATYTLNIPQGRRAVLMFSDDTGFHQSSNLFVVGGNNSSSSDCLPVFASTPSLDKSSPATASSGGLSRPAVIVIAVVISVVVAGIAVAMAVWSCMHRRKLHATADNPPWSFSSSERGIVLIAEKNDIPTTEFALDGKQSSIVPSQNSPSVSLQTRHSDNISQYPDTRKSIRSPVSSASLRSLVLLQPGGSSAVNRTHILPSLPTSPFDPALKQAVSRTPSQHTSNIRSTRFPHPTSISSEDIEYMLEVGTLYSPTARSVALRSSTGAGTTASNSRSNVELVAVNPPPSSNRDYERPLPRLPSPTYASPSFVRTSEGMVVTSTYDASNWVARSMPSSPDSSAARSSRSQTLLSPASHRDPPHALIPSSPTSPTCTAPDSPYVVAGSRQP